MNVSTIFKFPDSYYRFQSLKILLDKISIPYLILIGFIGLITNTSTIFLISKHFITKNLKNKWTLIALALSDLLFNIALLIRVIHDIFHGNSENLCMILSFLSHLAELLSAFYTVSFTIQRYIAVRYPLKVALKRHSSPIISLVIIFISSSTFCFFLTYQNSFVHCHEQLELAWFIADGILSFFVPFLSIIIFNILIINFIRKYSRSPMTIQTRFKKKQNQCRNTSKRYLTDETCVSDNNTVTNFISSIGTYDDSEQIELKNKKEEKISINCVDQHSFQSITRGSLRRMNSNSSTHPSIPQSRICSSKVPKHQSQNGRRLSHDSSIYIPNGGSCSLLKEYQRHGIITTRTSQSIRVTRMLILVSTCFLILNAPAHICIIATKIYTGPDLPPILIDSLKIASSHSATNLTSSLGKFHLDSIVTISSSPATIIEDSIVIHILYLSVFSTQLIAYASYSINFFLYSFSGIAFRTSLRQSFTKLRRH